MEKKKAMCGKFLASLKLCRVIFGILYKYIYTKMQHKKQDKDFWVCLVLSVYILFKKNF